MSLTDRWRYFCHQVAHHVPKQTHVKIFFKVASFKLKEVMGKSLKVVALVSGGKDSCYSMLQCVSAGHQIVALANLRPKDVSSKSRTM